DARRHYDDVPLRSLRRRFALPVHDANLQWRTQDLFRNRTHRESFSCSRPRNDSESLPRPGELADLGAVLPLEDGRDVETERKLNGLACSPGGRNDDYPPRGWLGCKEC